MSKILIGISGKMGTGKSTISKNLKGIISETMTVNIVSAATPLYDLQNIIYDKFNLKVQGDKDRDLLKKLGAWARDKNSDTLLNHLIDRIYHDTCSVIICDDVRYVNEATFFKNNGILIRLEGEQRGNNVNSEHLTSVSETSLDDFKFNNVVSNKNSIGETTQKIFNIIKSVCYGY